MLMYKQLLINYLDRIRIDYSDRSENRLRLEFPGAHMKQIPIFVMFDLDGGNTVSLKCWDIGSFLGRADEGIRLCNKLNNNWRWVTFSIDEDSDMVASLDFFVDAFSCGDLCYNLIRRMVSIIDEAYPDISAALS